DNTAPAREDEGSGSPSALESAWAALLALSRSRRAGSPSRRRAAVPGDARLRLDGEGWSAAAPLDPGLAAFLDLYHPFAAASGFAVGHLGQSLDGRIATAGGASQWLTGAEDLRH